MNSDIILCHPSYLPSSSQDRGPGRGTDLPPGHTASGARVSPWPGFFSTPPVTGREASWQPGPGGQTQRGGKDPPCHLRGRHPALWNTAVGQTQSFQPTWWRGEGGGQLQACFHLLSAQYVPGSISRLLHASPLLMHTETQGGRSYYPHFSDEEPEALKGWPLIKVT